MNLLTAFKLILLKKKFPKSDDVFPIQDVQSSMFPVAARLRRYDYAAL